MSFASDFSSNQIDLNILRHRFAIPARVTESAFLRREIADRMHERLSLVKLIPNRIVDAGCGEGADLIRLKNHFSSAQIFAIDASYGMLEYAKKEMRNRSLDEQSKVICGNFAQLPFASNSFEMVWSNLALHWHPEPLAVFLSWRRILNENGVLWFSCFGPETIGPVKEAFRQLDNYEHVIHFMEMHDLGDCLVKAGFPSPILDREIITVTYSNIQKCLEDIQSFGGNPLVNQRKGLMGKQTFQKLMDLLEKKRSNVDGKLHMPYEIIYGHAFCTVNEKEKNTCSSNFTGVFHKLKCAT